jgi:GH3 auxin-responsive promoter
VAGWRYHALVEFRGLRPSADAARVFLTAMDRALARLNREYADRRASRRLRLPRLYVMRPGWAERQCRADVRNGKRDVQYKWPAIKLECDGASPAEVMETIDSGGSADA